MVKTVTVKTEFNCIEDCTMFIVMKTNRKDYKVHYNEKCMKCIRFITVNMKNFIVVKTVQCSL